MEENYFSYYLLKVIENDMKYMFQEQKKVKFFFLKCNFFGSLFIRYSFTLSHVVKAFYYETFCEKNEQKKKVYYFFKIYCKNPHFQIFIAALAGILACSFVIYSEHST